MKTTDSFFRMARMGLPLAAALALIAGAAPASAKSSAKSSGNQNSSHLREIPSTKQGHEDHKNQESKRERKQKSKEATRERKEKNAQNCRKNCNDTTRPVPVTTVGGTVDGAPIKTALRLRANEVLGFESKTPGSITITEFTGKAGVLRQVSVGGSSITLSSSVANAFRLTGGDGKSGNIEINNTVTVKQNPDGSVTVSAVPPTLKGL